MDEEELYEEHEKFSDLYSRIRSEGLHETFRNYSSFPEIEDEEFHKLRKFYLQYSELLENYIIDKLHRLDDLL